MVKLLCWSEIKQAELSLVWVSWAFLQLSKLSQAYSDFNQAKADSDSTDYKTNSVAS